MGGHYNLCLLKLRIIYQIFISHFFQRRSRIEPDGIAARTGNGGDGEATKIVRRFERALARGKSLDRATDEVTKKPKWRSAYCEPNPIPPGRFCPCSVQ